jgi:uncharacterized membrane protein YdbT with pleckstrin-like domain
MKTIEAQISTFVYAWGPILIGILLLPVKGIGLLVLLLAVVQILIIRATNRVSLNEKTVEFQTGIISKDVRTISLRKIESIELKQPGLSRAFGYGTLRFHGTGASNAYTPWIKNPAAFKAQVESRIEEVCAK